MATSAPKFSRILQSFRYIIVSAQIFTPGGWDGRGNSYCDKEKAATCKYRKSSTSILSVYLIRFWSVNNVVLTVR